MHREAEQYATKAAQRNSNVRTTEHKEWAKQVESERTAERQKAPPREYPWPWRREK